MVANTLRLYMASKIASLRVVQRVGGEIQDDDDDPGDDAVNTEEFKAPLFQKRNKAFDRQQGDDKGDNTPDYQQFYVLVHLHRRKGIVFMEIPEVFDSSAKHGGHGQKEREFGSGRTAQLLRHTAHNRCSRTRHARNHGQTLKEAYF